MIYNISYIGWVANNNNNKAVLEDVGHNADLCIANQEDNDTQN